LMMRNAQWDGLAENQALESTPSLASPTRYQLHPQQERLTSVRDDLGDGPLRLPSFHHPDALYPVASVLLSLVVQVPAEVVDDAGHSWIAEAFAVGRWNPIIRGRGLDYGERPCGVGL